MGIRLFTITPMECKIKILFTIDKMNIGFSNIHKQMLTIRDEYLKYISSDIKKNTDKSKFIKYLDF